MYKPKISSVYNTTHNTNYMHKRLITQKKTEIYTQTHNNEVYLQHDSRYELPARYETTVVEACLAT